MNKADRGYTLIEVLVAVFLAVNVFAGVMVTYTASIRYLGNIRAQQTGSSNAQMALSLMEKELYNVNCVGDATCDDVGEIISIPLVGASGYRLGGRVQTTAGGSVRRFRFCYKNTSGCEKMIRYCSEMNPLDDNCYSSTTCTLGACSAATGWLTIARNIEAFTVTRSTTSDIQIQITANEGSVAVSSRTYYSSVSISYGQ